jgi:membrane-associated phospholipid phosphatase
MRFLQFVRPLHRATENIPDILPHLVGIGTILMWAIYFYRWHKKKNDVKTKFLLLAATALPAVYLIKTFFQFSFGRTSTRLWLTAGKPLVFHWFKGFETGSFPSGHMTVFTAFGTAVLLYYPQHLRLVLIILSILGLSLIITDYHYLSDVIAGAYLGFITTYSLWYLLDKRRNKH